MFPFNQPNIERKNCVWTTKNEKISEICIVQHVEMKSVPIFQQIKRLVSTTVKSAKPAATFWIFFLRTKNWQLFCLVMIVHIVLQKRRVATTKTRSHLHFWSNFSATHKQALTNLNQKRQKLFPFRHNRVDTPLVGTINQNFIYILILHTFSLN